MRPSLHLDYPARSDKATGRNPMSRSHGGKHSASHQDDFAYQIGGGGAGGGYTKRRHSHRRRRRKRILTVVLVAVLALLLVGGGTAFALVNSAKAVRSDLSTVKKQAATLEKQLSSGDSAGMQSTVASMADTAASMKHETSSLAWKVASLVPVYGQDVKQVRTLCSVFDDLSNNALVPMSKDLSDVSLAAIIGEDGTINVEMLRNVFVSLGKVQPVVERTAKQMDALGETHITQLKKPVEQLDNLLGTLDTAAREAGPLSESLPSMLGVDGPRTYLVIAQNNSEIRATGGFPGSMGPMTVDNGKLSMGEFRGIGQVKRLDRINETADAPAITDEESVIFGTRMVWIPGDAGFTPDFPRFAEIMREHWAANGYGDVDGVIAIDPLFLQEVLKLLGGVTASNGETIDGTNAVKVLLHDIYNRGLKNAEQDAVFSEVAELAFDKITSDLGKAKLSGLIHAVGDGVSNGHLKVWCVESAQESLIRELGCGGEVSTDETAPALGVYFNDVTYSKMSWYLSTSTQIGAASKNPDGSYSYTVSTVMHNNITKGEASENSKYVEGSSGNKRGPDDMLTFVYLYAPAGGSISDLKSTGYFTGAERNFRPAIGELEGKMIERSLNGFDVWFGETQMLAGESVTITYKVTTSPKASTDKLAIQQTPTLQSVAGW